MLWSLIFESYFCWKWHFKAIKWKKTIFPPCFCGHKISFYIKNKFAKFYFSESKFYGLCVRTIFSPKNYIIDKEIEENLHQYKSIFWKNAIFWKIWIFLKNKIYTHIKILILYMYAKFHSIRLYSLRENVLWKKWTNNKHKTHICVFWKIAKCQISWKSA